MSSFLSLYLDAPMQSWGYMSKFDRRTSLGFPTKSGIAGILCAAMGIGKDDRAQLAKIAKLEMKVYVLAGEKCEIRRITDYHTVGGGFDEKKSTYERQSIVKKADGGVGGTVQTYREYLLDAKFGVLLSGDETLLTTVELALQNPRWGVWLGRKSCVPTAPLSQGIHKTLEEAISAIKSAFEKTHGEKCEIRKTVTESPTFSEGRDSYMDLPIDFGERKFSFRRVSTG